MIKTRERDKKSALLVRAALPADMPAVADIYAHHVRHGLASFELEPPDTAEMTRRHAYVVELGLPYLVAELDHRVVGYAYVAPYRTRPAYRYTVANSASARSACCPPWAGNSAAGWIPY